MFSDFSKLFQCLFRKKDPSAHHLQNSARDRKEVKPQPSETEFSPGVPVQKSAPEKSARKPATPKANRRRKAKGGKKSRTTRQGIQVLSDNDDLHALFDGKRNAPPSESGDAQPPSAAPKQPVLRKRASEGASGRQRVKRVNKNGLPVFDANDNLHDLFETAIAAPEFKKEKIDFSHEAFAVSRQEEKKAFAGNSAQKAPCSTNKHGLPFLNPQTDLRRTFKTDTEIASPDIETGERSNPRANESSREAFARMLEDSLAGKNRQSLLKEKKDNLYPRKPLSVKQRIKRYPPPQGQLDLHGFTASQAEQKVDAYLRNAYQREIFTLRLIVGKGLHSEAGAVLPDVVEDKLIELKHQRIVLAYQWEKKLKAKSGAIIVYLAIYD